VECPFLYLSQSLDERLSTYRSEGDDRVECRYLCSSVGSLGGHRIDEDVEWSLSYQDLDGSS